MVKSVEEYSYFDTQKGEIITNTSPDTSNENMSSITQLTATFPPHFDILLLILTEPRLMDHTATKAARRACKDGARVIVSMVVMLMLVWILAMGYQLATETGRGTEVHGSGDGFIALVFGVATVVFGMVYFIIGLTIVAELALDLLAWLQGKDAKTINSQEENTTFFKVCIQAAATMVSMLMLAWAIYHGCKLAVEAPKGGIHNCLVFVTGFTTMAFGFIYFIIGISIVAESVLHLTGQLHHDVNERYDIHEDRKNDALLPV